MPPDAAKPARWEDDTVPLSRPLTDTLELPVVTDPAPGPTPPPSQPLAPPASDQPLPPTPPPNQLLASPATQPLLPPVSERPPRPQRPARKRRRPGRWLAVALIVALLGAGVAAGLGLAKRQNSTPTAGAALAVRSVSSVDPSGGSGWRRSGDALDSATWRTQHYRSAEFGGLKSGVGLLLDLGTKRRLSAVRTSVEVPGTAVELRAGDSAGSAPGSFRLVDRAGSASGRTTLQAGDGGGHRYWLVWVPRLGSDGSGYSAELRGLTVRG